MNNKQTTTKSLLSELQENGSIQLVSNKRTVTINDDLMGRIVRHHTTKNGKYQLRCSDFYGTTEDWIKRVINLIKKYN